MATNERAPEKSGNDSAIENVVARAETASKEVTSERVDAQVDTSLTTSTHTRKRTGALGHGDVLGALDHTTFEQPTLANARVAAGQPTAGTVTSLGGKLDQSTAAQERDNRRNLINNPLPRETMRARVEKMMVQYESRFAGDHRTSTNNAVLIAMAIQGAARVIADEMFDPALEATLAKQLAEVYAAELRAGLPDTKDGDPTRRKASVELGAVLASDDPVARYMHNEMRLEDAAGRITRMAQAGNTTAPKMFNVLRDKWEAELASYTYEDVKNREHNKGKSYSTREGTGEMSTAYMQSLFGTTFTTGAPPENKDKSLNFAAGASARLDALSTAVDEAKDVTPGVGKTVNGVALTGNQAAHLRDIAKQDRAVKRDRVEQCVDVLVNQGVGGQKLSDGEARAVIKKLQSGMGNIPLTVTVKGHQWFGEGASVEKFDPNFKPGSSRRNEVDAGAAVGKPGAKPGAKLPYLGKWQNEEDGRGEAYLKFRTWKDQQMTGNRGFADSELPSFGALNANFTNTGGTGGAPEDVNTAYKAETKKNITDVDADGTGTNYYGDVHFVLDPAKVGKRLVYTATDHGRPHTDPFLMLADFLCGDGANDYKASLTGVEVNAIKNEKRAAQLINAALRGTINVRDDRAPCTWRTLAPSLAT